MIENIHKDIQPNLGKYSKELVDMKPQEMLTWGYEKFDNQFAIQQVLEYSNPSF